MREKLARVRRVLSLSTPKHQVRRAKLERHSKLHHRCLVFRSSVRHSGIQDSAVCALALWRVPFSAVWVFRAGWLSATCAAASPYCSLDLFSFPQGQALLTSVQETSLGTLASAWLPRAAERHPPHGARPAPRQALRLTR